MYSLVDTSSPTGVYGLVVQVTSPGYVPSEPFLVPLEWDFNNELTPEYVDEMVALMQALVEPLNAADFDADGDVDVSDFQTWSAGYGASSGAFRFDGDSNADGDVDGSDFLSWQAAYEFSAGSSAFSQATAVPEPDSAVLVCLATLFIGLWGIRLRNSGLLAIPTRFSQQGIINV